MISFKLKVPEEKRIYYLWFRTLVWCIIIFSFSSIPNFKGKQPNFETWIGIFDFVLRKGAHLIEYAVLMIFIFRAVEKSWTRLQRWHFWMSFGFVILFSISDEWHQTFVYGRSGTGMDVFIDTVGSVIAYSILTTSNKTE